METLTIDYDDDDGWVTLRTLGHQGKTGESSFQLRDQFHSESLLEALLATGWVEPSAAEYRLTKQVSAETLCRVVGEMFAYFDAPNRPGTRLLGIKQAVDQYAGEQDVLLQIPLWAYAWLDLIVREDLADEARSVENVWSQRPLAVDTRRHCQRRVKELLGRYVSATGTENNDHRRHAMAASARRRDPHREKETG